MPSAGIPPGPAAADAAADPGPRRRILAAATDLFYRQGIQATGISELCETAHVSKRTLYQFYGSKDELVAAYLDRLRTCGMVGPAKSLERTELDPRERLLGMFDPPPNPARYRGCPFANAAVETPDRAHPAHRVITAYKQAQLRLVADTARDAGCRRVDELSRELLVMFEGATALAATLGKTEVLDFSRRAAQRLIDSALAPDPPGSAGAEMSGASASGRGAEQVAGGAALG